MIARGTDILKLALNKKDGELEFKLYSNNKIKKNKLHNKMVMNLLSILDNTEYTISYGGVEEDGICIIIKHDAIEYIVKYLGI